jgi:hypothetical protein
MKLQDVLKKTWLYIVVGVFWIAVTITFIGGCVGTFFKSADEPNDDYEEYIHSTLP